MKRNRILGQRIIYMIQQVHLDTAVQVFIINSNNIKAKQNTEELHQEMQCIKLCSVTTTQWQPGKSSEYRQHLISLYREQAASTSHFVFWIFLEVRGHLSLTRQV